jgi:hypothetical protein
MREGCAQFHGFNSSPSVFGGGLGGGLEAVLNLCENGLRLHQSFAIRKAQHAKPMLGEPLCASLIPRALIFMLPSIQLDYHHAFRRNRSRRCRARSDAGDETARLIDAAADASRAAARRSGRGAVAVPGRAGEEACSSQKILGRGSAVKNRHPALPRWTPTPTLPQNCGGGSRTLNLRSIQKT